MDLYVKQKGTTIYGGILVLYPLRAGSGPPFRILQFHKAVWVSLFKDIQAETVRNSKASAANRANGTGSAYFAAGTIATGYLRIIDLGNALL